MTNIEFVKQCIESKNLRVCGFQEAITNMRFESFSKEDAEFFASVYFSIKGDADRTVVRCLLLEALALQCLQHNLKDFFLAVFKKERKFCMRLTAIRGYSAYAAEAEVTPLMEKLVSLLHKGSMANCLYQEYEYLRSKFGLLFLVEYYGYDCFKKAMDRLNELYDALPDELKGYYTFDENGMQVQLLSFEEIANRSKIWLNKLNAGIYTYREK